MMNIYKTMNMLLGTLQRVEIMKSQYKRLD